MLKIPGKLVDKLSFYVNTDMKMLERDLKYENKDNIIKLFKSYSSLPNK